MIKRGWLGTSQGKMNKSLMPQCTSNLPLEGVPLPGLPGVVKTGFCLNPLCIHYGQSDRNLYTVTRHSAALTKHRPHLQTKLRCKACKSYSKVYSDQAIATIARASLARHWPVHTCPDSGCENYHVNVVDHPPQRAYSRYGKVLGTGHPRIQCNLCKEVFSIGEKPVTNRHLWKQEQFLLNTVIGQGLQDFLYLEILSNPGAYENTLCRHQKRCNFFSAFRGLNFDEAFKNRELHVYTDFMEIALKRPIPILDSSSLRMSVAISVIEYDRHLFLLGVTPSFQSMSKADIDHARKAVFSLKYPMLEEQQPYVHLEMFRDSKSKQSPSQPVQYGMGGSLLHRTYTALGHFHMLRVLLRSAAQVFHYMDHGKDLRVAALTSFSGLVLKGRADVTFVSYEKGPPSKSVQRKDREAEVKHGIQKRREAWKALLKRRRTQPSLSLGSRFDPTEAIIHRQSYGRTHPIAADKKNLNSLWIRVTPPKTLPRAPKNKSYNVQKSLWATCLEDRPPERELAVHLKAKTNPIDSCISAIRAKCYGTARPVRVATGLHGYRAQLELPARVVAALDMFRCLWNYRDRLKEKQITRAQHLEVSKKQHKCHEILYSFKMPDHLIPRKKGVRHAPRRPAF